MQKESLVIYFEEVGSTWCSGTSKSWGRAITFDSTRHSGPGRLLHCLHWNRGKLLRRVFRLNTVYPIYSLNLTQPPVWLRHSVRQVPRLSNNHSPFSAFHDTTWNLLLCASLDANVLSFVKEIYLFILFFIFIFFFVFSGYNTRHKAKCWNMAEIFWLVFLTRFEAWIYPMENWVFGVYI